MGLIKAGLGATGSVLGDQWKEYFYCDSMEADILVTKAEHRTGKRSSNKRGSENVITNGSVIAVADGQCMILVDQGKVTELCAEPGEFIYTDSDQPSIFYGGLGKGIVDSFKMIGKRFTFGGETPKDQRVYYVNTKELVGNKYGTPNPVPFRVIDRDIGMDIDISIRCFGEYSYHIFDPILFYTNVVGNVEDEYKRQSIDSQLKTELLTALQPAFAKISEMGIRYSALPAHTTEIANILNEELSEKWRKLRGVEIVSVGVSSVSADEEDEQRIKDMQTIKTYRNPTNAAGGIAAAQMEAMRSAAKNPNGAMAGFMGMGVANNFGGANVGSLFEQGQQQQGNFPQGAAEQGWTCSCGAVNTGKFCSQCGKPKPEDNSWTCSCGSVNTGKFCPECGKPKPSDTCPKCGAKVVPGAKFCSECGNQL